MALPGLSEDAMMVLGNVAMVAAMAPLMLYRWDRYSGGLHRH